MLEIPCPQANCLVKFTDNEIEIFAYVEDFKRYQDYKSNIQIDLNPSLKWCPTPDCRTAISKKNKTCEKCGTKICFDCGL